MAHTQDKLDPIQRRALRIIKGTATFNDRFVPDHDELVRLIDILRSSGCVIVFVTGVWDLFHEGHGKYLELGKEEAKKLYPDAEHFILVVGLDTDKLTQERKGPDRPIVPEDERECVLGFLRSVDIVTPQYKADTLFELVRHDVRIVSQSTKDLPQLKKIKEKCKHVVNLPPQSETSTTARIRNLALAGGIDFLERVRDDIDKVIREARDGIKK
ncbi:hypothetical protein COU13_01340 [Candidatus Kaiserbacteria bacterium CG10_big_fil_rev_8_21_14_0_10_43_70]|uniref:Cytidyltransferase-like domain-containing protein n=1 Tax=Candidatus Kaiserbacteria bacterium CG10_big_fil_rev_8_21_14_0_10_43_70 TaxID=1974605 RepID=A0A2H0UJ04_9BACT|nr:MAG: hypothetical protein COU13_01340 [Candidatus Kaiserbacteria bacterium CG10_big_fil_rev_8_21_14_0_10_43_70]